MRNAKRLIEISQELRSMAQTGLCYDTDNYQRERYNNILALSDEMLHLITEIPSEDISSAFNLLKEYATPKMDVRAVVFHHSRREILLSHEKCDGKWALPGGWSDVGETPSQSTVKEAWEEAGLRVTPIRLLMLLDYRKWNYPPTNLPIYKLFILCQAEETDLKEYRSHEAFDILGSGFFAQDAIPSLSTGRTSMEQINLLFEFYDNPGKEAVID
ncbi:MAG: NUDIX hydrolase N-terminal domain-containing protein [Bacteroides sp.]|nr:NUDIX hydrolase N-terminal domain-containing protein [Roseburia sp.]MCM1347564.1 NUDIX hydrolase N-terminal domain-containing protein [Bacteroides sp.]MCM1421202.1 NUDIX hydrolase N-terminal domain-containing protein [Bacteroides sp.]